ncbi:right-handed parallel beta-helix repeat-containing protein [Microbulbifer sp. GL-2]|uniref:right-handed parallel beta-helix repeat-containing protein n=1 Tax=Microbulbifer sp. GL-2 TaxID=2591606 RepID=UPI0011643ECE|nr:right-handed parallel beta-helix repeat-containing protein [Microbulbifer sp. GL-2]BBM04058.1 hypothetical protein GL2_41320 [Microbulbifer sp. GL-2]
MKIMVSNLIKPPVYASVLMCAFFQSSYALAVECGETIFTPTFLLEELNCPLTTDSPYALTVVGPTGYLRMLGGGKITCDNSLGAGIAGVRVKGLSSIVTGGEINSCPTGVILEGVGSHTVLNTKILDFALDGVEVVSSYNFISGAKILGPEVGVSDDGIFIKEGSDYNTISNNYIDGAGNDGILVDGEFAVITLNEIKNSGSDGVEISAENTSLTNNLIILNDDDGVDIETGFNTISGNFVEGNKEGGIDIDAAVTDNLINRNTVLDNATVGIEVSSSATNNTVKNNTALDNGEDDLVDLSENAECTNQFNTWSNNTADTSDPDCLKDL